MSPSSVVQLTLPADAAPAPPAVEQLRSALQDALGELARSFALPVAPDAVLEVSAEGEAVRITVDGRFRDDTALRDGALRHPAPAGAVLHDLLLRHRTLLAPAIASSVPGGPRTAEVVRSLRHGRPLGALAAAGDSAAEDADGTIRLQVSPDDPDLAAAVEEGLPAVVAALGERTGLRLPVRVDPEVDVASGAVRVAVGALRPPPIPLPEPTEAVVRLPCRTERVPVPGWRPASWWAADTDLVVPTAASAGFEAAGAVVLDRARYLVDVAARRAGAWAAAAVTPQLAERVLVQLATRQPELARAGLRPSALSRLVRLLSSLLDEGVRIADLTAVAETAVDGGHAPTEALLRRARARLLPQALLRDGDHPAVWPVSILDSALQGRLADGGWSDDASLARIALAMAPPRRDDVAILAVPAAIRRRVQEAIDGAASGVAVLAHEELAGLPVVVVSIIR